MPIFRYISTALPSPLPESLRLSGKAARKLQAAQPPAEAEPQVVWKRNGKPEAFRKDSGKAALPTFQYPSVTDIPIPKRYDIPIPKRYDIPISSVIDVPITNLRRRP